MDKYAVTTGKTGQKGLPVLQGGALDMAKVLAALSMLVAHIDVVLGYNAPAMFFIGRMAFPLFCYAVAVAVARAAPERILPYVTRLLLLAFACDVLVMPVLYPDTPMANVLFTLSSGAVFAFFAQGLRPVWRHALYAAAALSLFMPHSMEYGLMGIALPSAMLHAMRGDRHGMFWTVLLCYAVNAGGIVGVTVADAGAVGTFAGQVVTAVLVGTAAALALVVVRAVARFYRPDAQQFLPRYALYVFYPAHVVVLGIVARLMG